MSKNRHYIVQFGCIIAVFVALILQSFTKVVTLQPLKGFTDEVDTVEFNFKTYLDGSYQGFLTEYAKENTGFREFFIRNYNQFAFSCFDKITNDNIVKGYDNELFLKMYLNEVTGKRLEQEYGDVETAKAAARNNVKTTVALVDTLRSQGKHFLFVFAPTKTSVYSEKMPKYYQKHTADFSLEAYYIELFKENDIPIIDFYSYFKDHKDTIPYPIYSKYGSHWSQAVIPFVADSILRKMESITSYHLPSIQHVDANVSTDYFDYDHELEKNLNLLFPLERPAIPNPEFVLGDTLGKDRPNLLVVGDSYFDQLMFSCFKSAFNDWSFWQYNQRFFAPHYWRVDINKIPDSHHRLKNADIVMMMFTAPMLYNYMFGFLDSAFLILANDKEYEIQKEMDFIKTNEAWLDAIVKQAEEKGISVEENLRRNAIYVLESKKNTAGS